MPIAKCRRTNRMYFVRSTGRIQQRRGGQGIAILLRTVQYGKYSRAYFVLSPPLRTCTLHRANFAGPTGHVRLGRDSTSYGALGAGEQLPVPTLAVGKNERMKTSSPYCIRLRMDFHGAVGILILVSAFCNLVCI
jgi:hypothetical protein